jgi:hypothetical protein
MKNNADYKHSVGVSCWGYISTITAIFIVFDINIFHLFFESFAKTCSGFSLRSSSAFATFPKNAALEKKKSAI